MRDRDHRPQRELPFETQPDIEHDRDGRGADRIDRGHDQFARDLGADRFHRRKGDLRIGDLQRRLDPVQLLGGDRAGRVLRADADHRHMLFGAETGVEHLGDQDVGQTQPVQRLTVIADLEIGRAFGADRGAALEVDAEIQPHHQHGDQRQHHGRRRNAEGQPLPAEEVEMSLVRNKLQTECHFPVPLTESVAWACAIPATARSSSASGRWP